MDYIFSRVFYFLMGFISLDEVAGYQSLLCLHLPEDTVYSVLSSAFTLDTLY